MPDSAEACAAAADSLTAALNGAIDRVGRELGGYVQSLIQCMAEVRRRWPEATTEMDAHVEARDEFRAFHARVATDDLPRFEDEFKRQLNTNAIRELAQFNNWLRRQAEEIHSRVDRINEALGAIDYSPGRYILLVTERTVNTEVQDFRSELRAATDDTLSVDDDHYSEQRFLDVQRIIERFRGREGHADADRAWTRGSLMSATGSLSPPPSEIAKPTRNGSTTETPMASRAGRRKSWPTRSLLPRWRISSGSNGASRNRVTSVSR